MTEYQPSLFDQDAPPPPDTTPTTPTTPPAAPGSKHPGYTVGTMQRAAELLAEVRDGRYGLLDTTERVVLFEDHDRVRHALDEDLITQMIASGCIEEAPNRDRVFCYHGAIRRPVTPLRLTARGRSFCVRWNALVSTYYRKDNTGARDTA